jgi:hypothetical protein
MRGLPGEFKRCMQTELCPTECMALKCANVCNHDEGVSGSSGCNEKRTFERQGENFNPILFLTVLTQKQIIPINDLHYIAGKLTCRSAADPLRSSRTVAAAICYNFGKLSKGRAYACESSTTAGSRAAARQLHEGQLCSQPRCSHLHCQLRSAPSGQLERHSYAAFTLFQAVSQS